MYIYPKQRTSDILNLCGKCRCAPVQASEAFLLLEVRALAVTSFNDGKRSWKKCRHGNMFFPHVTTKKGTTVTDINRRHKS